MSVIFIFIFRVYRGFETFHINEDIGDMGHCIDNQLIEATDGWLYILRVGHVRLREHGGISKCTVNRERALKLKWK